MTFPSNDVVGEAARSVGHRLVKAIVIGGDSTPEGATKSLTEDPFSALTERIVQPPYSPEALARWPELSGELASAIDAMVKNVVGYGHRLVERPYEGSPDGEQTYLAAAKKERVEIENWIAVAALQDVESLSSLRKRERASLETTGTSFTEVLRNADGRIVGLKLLQAPQMRLGREDTTPTTISVPVLVRTEDGGCEYVRTPVRRRLRLFVQARLAPVTSSRVVTVGDMERRWFKSFLDPRTIDNVTGEVVPDEQLRNFEDTGRPMPEDRKANEILYRCLPSSRTPYGVPRWIGNFLSVTGCRAAEEVNLITLQNNNIPSLAILVSGGRLTDGTIARIKEFVETQVRGKSNFSQVMILEGESSLDGDETNRVKIEITPIAKAQHTDVLFEKYLIQCREAIRRSFRIPSLFLGVSDDLTKTSFASYRQLTDEQVFAPERAEDDWFFNNLIFADLGFKYWRLIGRTPNITDNKDLITLLAAAERTGGVTPKISRDVVADVFPLAGEAPRLDPEKIDPDMPFSLQLAERMKNYGDPTEMNQNFGPAQPPMRPDEVIKADDSRDMIAEYLGLAEAALTRVRSDLRESP